MFQDTDEIVKYVGTETEVTLPSHLDKYKVVPVGTQAFYNKQKLLSVAIPDKVTTIGLKIFKKGGKEAYPIPAVMRQARGPFR